MVGVFRYHAQQRDSWRRGRFRSAATAGMTPGSAATIAKANTDNDLELRFSYVCNDTSNAGYALTVSPRYASSGDRIYVEIKPGSINLSQRVSGVWSSLDTSATSSTQGVEYTIRVVCDGQDVTVYRTAPGALEELVLETDSCTVASTNYITFTPRTDADFEIDDIRVLSDDLSNTTTFAVNNANELTSMTDYNGSTTFAFDAWGRMTSKARGSYAAAYGYKYGQMLCSVTSNWPGEGGVTYDYGGNLQRRERTVDSTTVGYNWDGGFGLVSEEDDSGNLTRMNVGRLAEATGSNPSTGSYRYFHGDRLGSVRRVTNESAATLTCNEYSPYGAHFQSSESASMWDYGMLAKSPQSRHLIAFFRHYDPNLARWLQRDPLQMIDGPNMYAYAAQSPINLVDLLGLFWWVVGGTALGAVGGAGVAAFCHYVEEGNFDASWDELLTGAVIGGTAGLAVSSGAYIGATMGSGIAELAGAGAVGKTMGGLIGAGAGSGLMTGALISDSGIGTLGPESFLPTDGVTGPLIAGGQFTMDWCKKKNGL